MRVAEIDQETDLSSEKIEGSANSGAFGYFFSFFPFIGIFRTIFFFIFSFYLFKF